MSDSDDSSAASSGDEMLNMETPFSQTSGATTPSPAKKGNDNNQDDGPSLEVVDEGEQLKVTDEDQKEVVIKGGKKRKHEEVVEMDATEMEGKAHAKATEAFTISYSNTKVGTPDKLFWFEGTQKGKKMVHPVRVVLAEEVVGLNLPQEWDFKKCPIQYIQYPQKKITGCDIAKYTIVSKGGLCPYHGGSESNIDGKTWCATKFEQYSKQLKRKHRLNALDLKTEELFLQCVLDKSLAEGDETKALAEVDDAVPDQEISPPNNDNSNDEAGEVFDSDVDNDDAQVAVAGRRKSRRFKTCFKEKSEPLRVNDVIQYYKQQATAGNRDALCQATILAIDPKGDRIITIDDPYTILEPTHQVKRIKRYNGRNRKLEDIAGTFRPIENYVLKKEGDPKALGKQLAKKNSEMIGIIKKHQNVAKAKMKKDGFCLEDSFRDFK